MFSDSSIVKRTGQAWKLHVFLALTFAGGGSLFWGLANQAMSFVGFGMLTTLSSLVFASLAIRCPSCGARWFWQAISQQHKDQWFAAIHTIPACPRCSFNGGASAR